MFENKQLCFSLFLGEYRVKKVAFSGFFFSFFDGMSCANDDVDPSVPDEVHEVVDEVGGGEAGQGKDRHVLPHCGPMVKRALQTICIQ